MTREDSTQPSTSASEADATALNGLSATNLEIDPEVASKPISISNEGCGIFGKEIVSAAVEIFWSSKMGWSSPLITMTERLQSLPPATIGLQYSIACFEGMKAHRSPEGRIFLFRPDVHLERFQRSAASLGLPVPDLPALMRILETYVGVVSEAVPQKKDSSLYIRPLLFAEDESVGFAINFHHVRLVIVSSIVNRPYAVGGLRYTADCNYIRAYPNGYGLYKVAANYCATAKVLREAKQTGYSSVIWLFPKDDDHIITEGGMFNMFILWRRRDGKKELATLPLNSGIVLPGVTRRSILEIVRDASKDPENPFYDVVVSEKEILMKRDLIPAIEEHRLLEVLACGTAMSVAPGTAITYEGKEYCIESKNELCNWLNETMHEIQIGAYPSYSNWAHEVQPSHPTINCEKCR